LDTQSRKSQNLEISGVMRIHNLKLALASDIGAPWLFVALG